MLDGFYWLASPRGEMHGGRQSFHSFKVMLSRFTAVDVLLIRCTWRLLSLTMVTLSLDTIRRRVESSNQLCITRVASGKSNIRYIMS